MAYSVWDYIDKAQNASKKMDALRAQGMQQGIWSDPSAGAQAVMPGNTLAKNVKADKYGLFNLPERQHLEQVVDLYDQQKPFLEEGSVRDRVDSAKMLRDSALYNTIWNRGR